MRAGRGRSPYSPAAVTFGLTALLASAAVWLVVTAGSRQLPEHAVSIAVALGALFAAAEFAYVSVEFRHNTYSVTVTAIPLVLGLLVLPPQWLVVARVLGAAAALLVQRQAATKLAYNMAAFAFETALVCWLLQGLGQVDDVLTVSGALLTSGVLLIVDLLMYALVMALIRLHGGVLGRSDIAATLLVAGLFNVVSVTFALIALVLLGQGPLGWTLLAALSVVNAIGYLAHTKLSSRHEALAQVSDFVEDDAEAETVEALAGHQIARIRGLLGASWAHAVLVTPDSDALLQLSVDSDDELTLTQLHADELDWLLKMVQEQDEAVLVSRSCRDPRLRRWLVGRGVRDAVVVPLTHGDGLRGALLVTDRQADHASFTRDDVVMLRTLAGHLGVALRSTRRLQRLRHDATHDVLTGLSNRGLLQERLDTALGMDPALEAAVLLLDLDGFKEVNDVLGHDVGDRLLQVVGQRLVQCAPDLATVARLGGDEFAVLLTARHDEAHPDAVGCLAAELAEALAMAIAAPVLFDEGTVSVDVSIGLATSSDGRHRHDLLRHADTAMYAAKTSRGSVQRYTPELDRGRAERLALIADLRLALDRDEISLDFQPKVDLRTGAVTGAEALARWRHPRLGLLSPEVFIPLAEATGLIKPLTRIVLRDALTACRGWRDEGLDLTVAVNLSAKNVNDPELPGAVLLALHDAGVPADALVLEITESSVIDDVEATIPILDELVAVGVTISLDDFGTGYSSLSYLQRLPVQEVKIDRSFVIGLGSNTDDHSSAALVTSVVGLARAFGLRVVAEGVEDQSTLTRLAHLGCDVVQGYLLGRPSSAQVLAATARSRAETADVPVQRLRQRPVLAG